MMINDSRLLSLSSQKVVRLALNLCLCCFLDCRLSIHYCAAASNLVCPNCSSHGFFCNVLEKQRSQETLRTTSCCSWLIYKKLRVGIILRPLLESPPPLPTSVDLHSSSRMECNCTLETAYALKDICTDLSYNDSAVKFCYPEKLRDGNLSTLAGIWCLINAVVGLSGNMMTLFAIPYAAKRKK